MSETVVAVDTEESADVITEPEDDDLVVVETDEESADSGAPSAAKSQSRGIPRSAIRRVANKAQEVAEADQRTVEVAASLLGSGPSISEVTTAIMSASRSVTDPIRDVSAIAGFDPLEAGITTAGLERNRLKNIWALLDALGVGSKATMPSATSKAAIAIVKTIFALSDASKAEIESVSALLKKN